ncbi:MAG: hypothetical protein OEY22_08650 [Candidatus Bathyarchaeota archaeon]|nr:hypothetical protein [Candidatus Bathyarchaeota archaeon]MDH5787466.1 hypothetical protein [Candidatus Bathyarchaeota archaeon]
MRKALIVGLLCLAIFLAAYGIAIINAIPQAISNFKATATKLVSLTAVIITPNGDEGGGGRPYIEPGPP